MVTTTIQPKVKPRTEQINRTSPKEIYNKSIVRGSKPFVKPNPYGFTWVQEKHNVSTNGASGVPVGQPNWPTPGYYAYMFPSQNFQNGVSNAALSKLDDSLTIAENLFEAWYERREVVNMGIQAVETMLDFARNWRKPKFWAKLGKEAPADFPAAWLTYQFGIVPLIGTVDTVLKGVAQPLTVLSVKQNSSKTFVGSVKEMNMTFSGTYRVIKGCTVTPNPNPNVGLANISGLTMPFSTAWSVIPWGWAVDYFVNVSEMLQNVEAKHPGASVSDFWTTTVTRGSWNGREEKVVSWYDPNKGPQSSTITWCRYEGKFISMSRTLGGNAYKLHMSLPELGTNRFANLASALALALRGKQK